jgi:Flp pilus assembly protein TadD
VRFSRRSFVKTTSLAGAFWACHFPRTLFAAPAASPASPCLVHTGSGYAPFLEPFLQQIRPGSDEFIAEKYAVDIEQGLIAWAESLRAGARDPHHSMREWLAETLEASPLDQPALRTLRANSPLESGTATFPPATTVARDSFLASLERYLAAWTHLDLAEVEIDMIEILSESPLELRTHVHYDFAGRLDANRREQRTGEWTVRWRLNQGGNWSILSWTAEPETRARLTGLGFVDVTPAVLGQNTSYRKQMLFGIDHWRTVLDGASGIDLYGNNGISVGDFDGDGLDDIYVCQPAGLPNRLYKNRGDGTFVDVTEQAGVGVLDGTSCAIFADLTNSGRQDLIVVRTSGPLLFANRGNGTFELKPDAFQFARPPQGTFTGASVADYDRDGLLDVYFCTYSFYQGLSDYEYPNPYYDAQNGPPNFLLRNRGSHNFEDVTIPSGMDVSNNRFSFGAVWNDYDRDGWTDLYVVNDFGRKVLYRNNRNGTFTDVSAQAGIEDPGEGMSMTWFDYDNDGYEDAYVVNMWESAGRRVTAQPQFLPSAPEPVRKVFRQGAMGNTLLHNQGASGSFLDVTEESGTRFGGWNWGSEAWDFDHDGYPDVYVADGFVSGEVRDDLSSFYWRHIAARSLDAGGHTKAYADGWSAINEFIRSGYSWSGYQRNNFFLNNRNATFAEAAALLGIDCIEDSRSFALTDLDGDGRLEIVLKNRTAPQIRIYQNRMSPLGASILFVLRGAKSNRDAIGAVIELETAHGRQFRTLRAGSGFLSQNTKAVHFGLGEDAGSLRATILWPSGTRQVFASLPFNHRIEVVEDSAEFRATPFAAPHPYPSAETATSDESSAMQGVWMIDPILPPDPALLDLDGNHRSLVNASSRIQLLAFAAPDCGASAQFLLELERGQAELKKVGIAVTAIAVNAQKGRGQIPAHLSFPLLLADERASQVFSLFHRYLFDRRRDIVLPSAFLLESGKVVRIYEGAQSVAELAGDAGRIPRNAEERLKRALPFPGHYYRSELHHNYFTYGVAYLQHEYFDEARAAFEQSIERSSTNPAAYYNLGLICLNKGQFNEARTHLEKAVELDPANADAWNNLGVVMGQQGDYAQAQRDFERALDRQPAHLLALQNMVKLLSFQGKPQQARDLLVKAIEIDPHSAELHKGLGMLWVEEKDLDRARTEFEKAVELEPGNAEMLNGLGVVLMQRGESERAMRQFEQCARLAPSFDRAFLNMAVLYLSAGNISKAHDVLADFLRRQPDNDDVREALKEVDSRR